jgi:hypothetical protein
VTRKRPTSKDRFRAARRAAAKEAKKWLGGQMVFPWFDHPKTATSAKDSAGGQTTFSWFLPQIGGDAK